MAQFSLQPLLDLMQTRTDEATRRLGQLIASEHNAKTRLELLEQYREEYCERLRTATQGGLSPLAWKNFQDFIARIDEAITQQRQVVAGAERHTAAGQAHWREQNTKLKAIDTLSVRHQKRQQIEEGRREQKLLDEFTTRRHGQPKDE